MSKKQSVSFAVEYFNHVLILRLDNITKFLDRVTRIIGRFFSFCTIAMVLLMAASVLQRYFFNVSLIWQQELVRYLHAFGFMACAGYALLHQQHIRVDVLSQHFSKVKKARIELAGTILLLWPFLGVLLYYSMPFIASSWRIMEGSPEPNGLPYVYILKTFIAVFAVLLFLQSLSEAGKSLLTILKEGGEDE